MTYDEFVGQVQHEARLASSGQAVRTIRATLETLGERLHGGAAGNLAAQLPHEIGLYLLEPVFKEPFEIEEFFRRVSIRDGGVEIPLAIFHARAVIDVVRRAVSAGALEHVRAQLPEEYNRLFEIGRERAA